MTATTAERTYRMLENQTLWETAARVHEVFAARNIDHAVVGGVAVCLHGYRRNTVDLDLLIRPADSAAFTPHWNRTDSSGGSRKRNTSRRPGSPCSL